MLWVSDGQYYASTELKVKAGPPFIEISNNSGLIVQRGDSAFVSGYNLSVNTNLNAFGSDIVYKITSLPQYGVILKDDVPVLTFTAQDLQDECIEYRHNNRLVCMYVVLVLMCQNNSNLIKYVFSIESNIVPIF